MQCKIKTTHSTLDNIQISSVALQYVAWRKKKKKDVVSRLQQRVQSLVTAQVPVWVYTYCAYIQ